MPPKRPPNQKVINRTGGWRQWLPQDSLQWCVFLAALLSAYLMLVNLTYVTLWHDEGTNAMMAKNLVTQGALTGWDGRNLFFGISDKYYEINHDFDVVFPPWSALPSALGFLLFGHGEFGLRVFHALFGVLCLPLLWLILGLDFAERRRLRAITFILFALSPIVILYMRQGRYYSDAIFFALLAFYCYRRYMQGGKEGWAVGLMLSILVGFFNNYLTGVSFSLALASWHFIFFVKQTTRRQWGVLVGGGAVVAALCGAYLWKTGIIGGGLVLQYDDTVYQVPFVQRKFFTTAIFFRDIVRLGWVPLAVAIWWFVYVLYLLALKTPSPKKQKNKRQATARISWRDNGVVRWGVMMALLTLFSGLLSVQPISQQQVADLRYLVMALPFAMLMLARCIDWFFALSKPSGYVVSAVLMLTNFATLGYTFDYVLNIYQCKNNNFPFPSLVAEVHRPYASAIQETVEYLRTHAKQDDTILAAPLQDYVLLMYYLGDLLKFCCALPDDSSLPKEKVKALHTPIYQSDEEPDWLVLYSRRPSQENNYDLVYRGETFFYPSQRPETEFHCFHEIKRSDRTVEIYKKRTEAGG